MRSLRRVARASRERSTSARRMQRLRRFDLRACNAPICTHACKTGPNPGVRAAWRNAAASPQPKPTQGYMTTFSDLSLDPRVLQAVTESGYVTPTPIQVQAIPHALEGPRHPRHRPDRHRQDRRLRAADALPSLQGPRPRPHAAQPRARPDPRARRPGRRAVREVLGAPEALDGAADRRRQLQGPGQADRPRRRRADRHARAACSTISSAAS